MLAVNLIEEEVVAFPLEHVLETVLLLLEVLPHHGKIELWRAIAGYWGGFDQVFSDGSCAFDARVGSILLANVQVVASDVRVLELDHGPWLPSVLVNLDEDILGLLALHCSLEVVPDDLGPSELDSADELFVAVLLVAEGTRECSEIDGARLDLALGLGLEVLELENFALVDEGPGADLLNEAIGVFFAFELHVSIIERFPARVTVDV